MGIEDIFDINEKYFHCINHGGIYLYYDRKIEIYKLEKKDGYFVLGKELEVYWISSGFCDKCFKEVKENGNRKRN